MSRSEMLAAACAFLATLHAQLFNFSLLDKAPSVEVAGAARLEPGEVVAGQPCAIILELETGSNVGIEDMRVDGLPDAENGNVIYGESEVLPDRKSAKKDRTIRRFRLPARFLAPMTQDVSVAVQGMATVRRRQGGMSLSSSTSFAKRFAPFRLAVSALPEERRPQNFAGAVGTRFDLRQSLSPDHVRPGDLVTATYTLTFDGHCPSNIWPVIDHLSKEFKAYDPKEISRTANKVVWTQVLVPRTVAATNSAYLSLPYFNVRNRCYEMARAQPQRLVFVSGEAASTESTAVVVTNDEPAKDAVRGGKSGPTTLRMAPAETSPVVAVLPPGTQEKVLARQNGWLRIETPRAIGWRREGDSNPRYGD